MKLLPHNRTNAVGFSKYVGLCRAVSDKLPSPPYRDLFGRGFEPDGRVVEGGAAGWRDWCCIDQEIYSDSAFEGVVRPNAFRDDDTGFPASEISAWRLTSPFRLPILIFPPSAMPSSAAS